MSRFLIANILIWGGAGIMAFEAISPPALDGSRKADAVFVHSDVAYETIAARAPEAALAREILARPVFAPSRRPPTQRTGAGVEATSAPPDLRLTGIGGRADALFAHIENEKGEVALYSAGMLVDGWTVEAVRVDGVALVRDGVPATIVFDRARDRSEQPRDAGRRTPPAKQGAEDGASFSGLFTGNIDGD